MNLLYLWVAGSSAAISAILTIVGGTAKVISWLSKKFDQIKDTADRRHEDNIQRFAVIETKLSTLIKNGHK